MVLTTKTAKAALLDELAESPLVGARYAHDVVSRRIAAVEAEAARPWQEQYDTMTIIARELLHEAERGSADWRAFATRVLDEMGKLRSR